MPYLTACLALVIVFKDSIGIIGILILSKAKLVKFGLAGGIAFNHNSDSILVVWMVSDKFIAGFSAVTSAQGRI